MKKNNKKSMKNSTKNIIALSIFLVILICVTNIMNRDTENIDNKNAGKGTQTDENSMGVWNDKVYTNDLIGLKFNLPTGWTISTDEEIEQLNSQLEGQKGNYYMCAIHQITGNNINIYGEEVEEEMTEDKYINQLKEELTKINELNYTIGEESKQEVAGKEYETLESSISMYGVEISQKYYVKKINNYIISIIVTSTEGEDKINEIVKNFE